MEEEMSEGRSKVVRRGGMTTRDGNIKGLKRKVASNASQPLSLCGLGARAAFACSIYIDINSILIFTCKSIYLYLEEPKFKYAMD